MATEPPEGMLIGVPEIVTVPSGVKVWPAMTYSGVPRDAGYV